MAQELPVTVTGVWSRSPEPGSEAGDPLSPQLAEVKDPVEIAKAEGSDVVGHRGHAPDRGSPTITTARPPLRAISATEALNLGFRNGVLIFGGLIGLTWLARRIGGSAVLTCWIAYVLTRPLGASLGDLLTQAKDFGGLGLGASLTIVLFFSVIIVLVTREQVLANHRGGR